MNLTKHLAGLLGVAAGFGATAAPQAADTGVMEFPNVKLAAQAPPEQAPPEQMRAPQHGGMMAYKDPATGKLTGPTAEQAAALTARPRGAVADARPKPTLTRPAHGGVAVMLEGRHQRYALAHKDADGKISETCHPESKVGEHHEK